MSEYQEIKEWEDLPIKPELLRGIFSNGFERPSPIQSKAILPILEKRDILAQAQSGTGKTGTFSISALATVDLSVVGPQVIILSPTRELSLQTSKVIEAIGSFMEGLKVQLLVGGTSIDEDIRQFRESPPQILVGCPGRILDMLRRKHVENSYLKLMIVDEADEMLTKGFKDQLYDIFHFMPNDLQVALFSATMQDEIIAITDKILRNPVRILMKREALTLEGISQYFVAVDNDDQKYETLKNLYQSLSVSQCIIYCNSIKRVDDLYHAMLKENFPVCCIHRNMTKTEREKAYHDFKQGVYRVMISSDITARGFDVQQVSIVINFDVPSDVNTYLHRIGRSGRWGRKGTGINFITRYDIKKIKHIESFYQTQINELPSSF